MQARYFIACALLPVPNHLQKFDPCEVFWSKFFYIQPLDQITIFYAQLSDGSFNERKKQALLQLLPEDLCADILKYKNKHEQILRLGGKLLLSAMLQYLDLSNLSLNDIRQSGNHKPCFPSPGFQFNLAHSGDISICAGAMNGSIGVDIEQIKPIDTTLLQTYLTEKERNSLVGNTSSSIDYFYRTWTKKEAVLKAAANYIDDTILQKINTSGEPVILNGKAFYTQHFHLGDNYIACLAIDKKINPGSMVLKKIDL